MAALVELEMHRLMVRSSVGNNVRVTSQLVFASRELVTKKAAPVSDLHLVSIIACTRSRR